MIDAIYYGGSQLIPVTPGSIFLGICIVIVGLIWMFAMTPREERNKRWQIEFRGVLIAAALCVVIILVGIYLLVTR
jgi:uncharacterized BrkB/YihY/UPF0761 family membrane protein